MAFDQSKSDGTYLLKVDAASTVYEFAATLPIGGPPDTNLELLRVLKGIGGIQGQG